MVTVGLESHWPCVTYNSGITTYGLMHGLRKGDEHPAYIQYEYGTIYPLPYNSALVLNCPEDIPVLV